MGLFLLITFGLNCQRYCRPGLGNYRADRLFKPTEVRRGAYETEYVRISQLTSMPIMWLKGDNLCQIAPLV